jgi:hypothetical protein
MRWFIRPPLARINHSSEGLLTYYYGKEHLTYIYIALVCYYVKIPRQ